MRTVKARYTVQVVETRVVEVEVEVPEQVHDVIPEILELAKKDGVSSNRGAVIVKERPVKKRTETKFSGVYILEDSAQEPLPFEF